MSKRGVFAKVFALMLAMVLSMAGLLPTAFAEENSPFDESTVTQQPAEGEVSVEIAAVDPMTADENVPQKNPNQTGLEVYYFDLGRVDGILIRCDGETCFIDVGYDRNAKQALGLMRGLGIEKLDIYVGTHSHADHIEGAARIMAEMKPDIYYIPHKKVTTAILAASENAGHKAAVQATECVILTHGQSFQIGGARVDCLGPVEIVACNYAKTIENSNSLILKLTYGERTFLFTGDTSDSVLRAANKKYPGALDVDVFKNPHHNGKHAEDIVKMVSPKVTVFCTDNENQPVNSYKNLLKKYGSAVVITGSQNQGHILIKSDGKELEALYGYPLDSIQLNEVTDLLFPTREVSITGSIEPSDKADPRSWLSWKSSDTSVAKVSAGKLTAVGAGKATITATAINGVSDSIEIEVYSAAVFLEKSQMGMRVGDRTRIKAKIIPADAQNITGEWYSADDSIAWVTSDGEIIGVAPGITNVYARLSNGAEAVCAVKVVGIEVESVKLNKNKLTVPLGASGQMSVKFTPANATNQQLEWKSSDESILTVDPLGNVTAVGKGKAYIGVRAANGKYDVCEVTVK